MQLTRIVGCVFGGLFASYVLVGCGLASAEPMKVSAVFPKYIEGRTPMPQYLRHARMAPLGRRFAALYDSGVCVMEVGNPTPVATFSLTGGNPQDLAWTPDGSAILVVYEKEIVRWHPNVPPINEAEANQALHGAAAPPTQAEATLDIGSVANGNEWGFNIAISADGSKLVVSRGSAVIVADAGCKSIIRTFRTIVSPNEIAISPDGGLVYAASYSKGLQAYDVQTGNVVASVEEKLVCRTFGWTSGSRELLVPVKGSLQFRDPKTLKLVRSLKGPYGEAEDLVSSPDGKYIAWSSMGTIQIAAVSGDASMLHISLADGVAPIGWTGDGSEFLALSDSSVYQYGDDVNKATRLDGAP